VARRLCVALRGAGRLRCAEEVSWRLEGAEDATGVGRTLQNVVAAMLLVHLLTEGLGQAGGVRGCK
jgi:hypothetical protein